MNHEIKSHPAPFEAAWIGEKRFEVRMNDRNYQTGDRVRMREFEPALEPNDGIGGDGEYSGRWMDVVVGYVVRGPDFGLPRGMCVFGFTVKAFGQTYDENELALDTGPSDELV